MAEAMSNRHLRQRAFTIPENPLHTAKAWEDWIEGIEREFRYFKITEIEDKKDALLIYGGPEIVRLAKSLPEVVEADQEQVDLDEGEDEQAEARDAPQRAAADGYEQLKKKLNRYFRPRQNKQHARYQFLKMTQRAGESIAAYAARLREKARDCEFEATEEDRILEHLIQTINKKHLVKKAISRRFNLTRFLAEAAQDEETSLQLHDMDRTAEIARVEKKDWSKPRQNTKYKKPRARNYEGQQEKPRHSAGACNYCGKKGFHKPGENCPAYGKKCRKCGKLHHFESVCKSADKRTKKVEKADSSSDDDFIANVRPIKQIKSVGKTVIIQLNDLEIKVEPDSGADVNVMDKHQFKALQHRSKTDLKLEESSVSLKTLTSKLPVKGEFTATLRNATRGMVTKFIVIDEKIHSPPLLSKETLEKLGMLEIREDGSLREPNEKGIRRTAQTDKPTALLQKYKKVFEGVGKIKGMEAKLPLKPDAVPIAQKPRNVPYYLQKPLKEWLDKSIEDDLLERAPQHEPITWCSPLVVQPKPKFKETPADEIQPHMIRACVDLRIPNKSMERCKVTPAPVVEDFTHRFHQCKIFSKLDMNQGYHQLVLDQESRSVATFSTPWGNIRPKRLIFGAKAAQDVFDEAIYRIFGDIPYCMTQRDDILIGGRTQAEHDETLETVLRRAEEFGVTFNKDKCKLSLEQIEFFGFNFTKDGIKPTKDKVKAIQDCKPPESKEAVRSFLGMTGYLSKFLPRYSVLTAPLRELTHKDTPFAWGPRQQVAFENIKKNLTSEKTMSFFNPALPITLRCEASFNEGLSAGLFQETEEGLKPVHFISRAMTDVEKRYSQTEKDALAIAWAKNRLHMYLAGAPKFRIITSHKPLIPMFSKASAKLPPRIEKWVMGMQDVDFEIVYVPGKDAADPMDYLSRHPLENTGVTENKAEASIKAVQIQNAVVMDKIKQQTQEDEQLCKLKERILKGDWEKHRQDPDIHPFYSVRHELYVADGAVFRLAQVILPKSLQRKATKAAHSLGHLGVTKMKQMMREKYWFPEMNKMVENIASQCFECNVTTKQNRPEPVKLNPIPEEPWHTLAIDFGGPYADGHYNLVIVDKRTRFVEVERVYSTNSKSTTKKLLKVMSTHGIPKVIESDNGPPFTSAEFKQFMGEYGIKHHRITPLHPRANGEAESFMRLVNKTEQIANLTGEDSERAIAKMLMGYRSTPHPATQVSPYRALMNREVRTKIDHENTIARDIVQSDTTGNMDQRDMEYKLKMKQYSDKHSLERHFIVGDLVLVRQPKRHKLSTAYEPAFYTIVEVRGSSIRARRLQDNREVYRDASHFKLANTIVDRTVLEARDPEAQELNQQENEIHTEIQEESAETDQHIDIPKTPASGGKENGKNGNVSLQQNPTPTVETNETVQTEHPPLRRSTRIRKPVDKLNL